MRISSNIIIFGILGIFVMAYYIFVVWTLIIDNKKHRKKTSKKDNSFSQINSNFVNDYTNNDKNMSDVLDELEKETQHNELLESFKVNQNKIYEPKKSYQNEKLKVIKNEPPKNED